MDLFSFTDLLDSATNNNKYESVFIMAAAVALLGSPKYTAYFITLLFATYSLGIL